MDLRKRMIWVGTLTIAVASVQFVATRRKAEQLRALETPLAARNPGPEVQAAEPPSAPSERAPSASAERVRARAEREALRAKITAAQRGAPANSRRWPAVAPAPPDPAHDSDDGPGTLKNRIGGHDQLVAHLNSDFMPLARECVQQAKARSPGLHGMLTLHIETSSDEQLGALVERAEVPAASEVQERELAECIRETAMTLTFPPPIESGSDQFELTLRIDRPSSDER